MIKSETSECGIFAIAFATALAYGENPTKYLFDRSEMRSHLTMFGTGTNDHVPIQKAA